MKNQYKIEDVYNIAEEIQFHNEDNIDPYVSGHVSVDILNDKNETIEILTREYEIKRISGFKWTDEEPKSNIKIDWDYVRFDIDEAFFNHYHNRKQVLDLWKGLNEYDRNSGK